MPTRISLIAALFGLCPLLSYAKPLDFSAPASNVGSTDARGYVALWSELGGVDFGNGLVLPLRIGFTTDPAANGLGGFGFWVPLLEAHEYLLNQREIKVTLVNGDTLQFICSPTDLHHFFTPNKEWEGLLGDDKSFIMSRNDGWTLKYAGGRIIQLKTDTGRVLDWEYNGGVPQDIKKGGRIVPEGGIAQGIKEGGKMVLDSTLNAEGMLQNLTANSQTYILSYDKRPRLQVVEKETLVSDLESSVNKIAWPDGSNETYTFGLTDERVPTLVFKGKSGKETAYSWNAATNKILTEGDWKYSVGGGNPAAISRQDSAGHSEAVSFDGEKGITTFMKDGIKTVYQYFVLVGPLFGKVRDISEVANGKTKSLLRLAYNEKGEMIRTIRQLEDGSELVTGYTNTGDIINSHLEPTKDPAVLLQLQQEEKTLLEALGSTTSADDKSEKLEDLADFYIHKAHDLDKAAGIVAQINSTRSFALKLQLIDYNEMLSSPDKIKAYQALYDTNPEHRKYLDFLVNVRKSEASILMSEKPKTVSN